MKKITIALNQSYDVLIGAGILPQIGKHIRAVLPKAQLVAIVTDDHVGAEYAEKVTQAIEAVGLSAVCYSIKPGEASKNGENYLAVLEWLAEQGLTRSDCVLALGGGVVGDLAGFVAATYRRGVPFVQVPTTLLAMVDSSVGGKTAINLPSGKNLAGAFYQPKLVLCDTATLGSLPKKMRDEGFVEVIKYAMLDRRMLKEFASASGSGKSENILDRCVSICVTIKRDIVQQDELDTGHRQLLNFGHTIGHAVERLSDYTISHGAAVAIGMIMETRAAVKQKHCSPLCLAALEGMLGDVGFPTQTTYSAHELYDAILHDKKRYGDEIVIPIPVAMGGCALKTMPISGLLEWIKAGLA